MPARPRTFVQLHYHDRPGGVTQVMRWYARAFRNTFSNAAGSCVLVCAHDAGLQFKEFPDSAVVSLPEAGYVEYATVRAFEEARTRIIERLFKLLGSPSIRKPVVVAAHNLTLMKNAALVSAYAAVARKLRDCVDQFRFFSIVHDCAEQGRVEQLRAIRRLERTGIRIADDCSMKDGAVHHVTVHGSLQRLFLKCGFAASLLSNPVVQTGVRLSTGERERILGRLRRYCSRQGILLDQGRPLCAYPARTIARKNPVEAIALACIVFETGLLLGPSGSSRADQILHNRLKSLITRFFLPVLTDAQQAMLLLCDRGISSGIDPVSYIYSVSDFVLSTSIAESFGYYLYEPFLYNLPVAGRLPVGFTYASGITNRLLYERLPVPEAWVDTKRLKKKYAAIAKGCLHTKSVRDVFLNNASRLMSGEYIDFALLDDWEQIDLLEKILSSDAKRSQWRALLARFHIGRPDRSMVPDLFPAGLLDRNRHAVRKTLSLKYFEKEFRRCFSLIPARVSRAGNKTFMQRAFLDPRLFRVR